MPDFSPIIERLAEALEPFAKAADSYDPDEGDGKYVAWAHGFSIGSLRKAREALALFKALNDTNRPESGNG
jgi:hypothetical protein